MVEKNEFQLTEGSRYHIYSIGGRDNALETEGIFRGYPSFGIDAGGLIIELGEKHDKLQGVNRILPAHAILAIDVLDEKPHDKKDDEKEHSPFYG